MEDVTHKAQSAGSTETRQMERPSENGSSAVAVNTETFNGGTSNVHNDVLKMEQEHEDISMDTSDLADISAPAYHHSESHAAPTETSVKAEVQGQYNVAPVSDLEIAARYADMEIQSVAAQFASATVDSATRPAATRHSIATNGSHASEAIDDDDDDDDSDDDEEDSRRVVQDREGSASGSDSDDEDDRNQLRAEIEAAMEKEANKTIGPVKTANEIASVPVREPNVELTPDCPIAQCGTILNTSIPGLMITIKSGMDVKPLDEGSVLCLADRTVLGCVDEVFGPVLMPMYVVRFESAEKMPPHAMAGMTVYYATEHTTYIIPEKIKDKGTDASNIFDEETDEVVYSDDEAEAAAKRQNRKRNRGGNPSQGVNLSSISSEFNQNRNGNYHGSGTGHQSYGGRGRGRGGSGYVQPQGYGGFTKYTQPGYNPLRPQMSYGNTVYTTPSGYGLPQPPLPPGAMSYHQMPVNPHQPPPRPLPHHPSSQYDPYQQQQHPSAYPPPPQGQYYTQSPPPLPGQGAYPPRPNGYYDGSHPKQQHQYQQPPPPPLPPGPPYEHGPRQPYL